MTDALASVLTALLPCACRARPSPARFASVRATRRMAKRHEPGHPASMLVVVVGVLGSICVVHRHLDVARRAPDGRSALAAERPNLRREPLQC